MKKIIPYIVFIFEFIVAAYLAYISYFLSAWFINDSVAVRLKDNDWNMIAVWRVLEFLVVGLVFSLITFFINKYVISHFMLGKKQKLAVIISVMIFFMIVIPSIIGAIEFAIEKPFM